MPKRRRKQPQAGLRRPEPRRPDDSASAVLASAVRRACNQCGSSRLAWGHLGCAIESAKPVQRAAFMDALLAGFDAGMLAWWCESCDALGLIHEPFPAELF